MVSGHSRGFTLLELLVVIAILGVIAMVTALNISGFYGRAGQISEMASYTIYVVEEGEQKSIGIAIFGDVLIRYPRRMNIGDSEEVSLTLIPPDGTPSEPDATEEPADAGTYYLVSDEVQFYSVMYAELNAVSFGISTTSIEYKAVSPTSRTDWVWIVSPNTVGEQLLRVELSTPVRVEGYEELASRAVYSQQIQILVEQPFSWRTFLEDWRLILGIMISVATALGLLFGIRKARKRKETQTADK